MKPIYLALIAAVGVSTGCANKPEPLSSSALNQARVSVFLKKGETTQDQVLSQYGPPNIITMDSEGREVWTYQRHAVSGYSADANISGNARINHGTETGVLSNIGNLGSGFISAAFSGSGYSESSKTVTLTIKFGRHRLVQDYNSIYSSF